MHSNVLQAVHAVHLIYQDCNMIKLLFLQEGIGSYGCREGGGGEEGEGEGRGSKYHFLQGVDWIQGKNNHQFG